MRTFFLHPLSYGALAVTVFGLGVVSFVITSDVVETGLKDPLDLAIIVLCPILALTSLAAMTSNLHVTATTLQYRFLASIAYEVPLHSVLGLISFTLCDGLVCDMQREKGRKRRTFLVPRVLHRKELAAMVNLGVK